MLDEEILFISQRNINKYREDKNYPRFPCGKLNNIVQSILQY